MTTLIDPADPRQLDFVVELLRAGKPVALPTETVYGLAGVADEDRALARIFELKARPHFDPLIVHVLDYAHAAPWIRESGRLQRILCEEFWPGPLTVLFRKSARVSDLCTAGSEWVALRSPAHPVFRRVLELLGSQPLAAPSANRFASISPTSSDDVLRELAPYGLEAVVEGGHCEHGLESTVVKVHSDSELEIVRPGALSREALQSTVGPGVRIHVRESGSGAEVSHEAPGQHHIHYAPSKPLYLVPANGVEQFLVDHALEAGRGAQLEVLGSSETKLPWLRRTSLSKTMNWSEAAAALFATLRELDRDPRVEFILAVECGTESLGLAIMDRLKRASVKKES